MSDCTPPLPFFILLLCYIIIVFCLRRLLRLEAQPFPTFQILGRSACFLQLTSAVFFLFFPLTVSRNAQSHKLLLLEVQASLVFVRLELSSSTRALRIRYQRICCCIFHAPLFLLVNRFPFLLVSASSSPQVASTSLATRTDNIQDIVTLIIILC